MESVLEPLSKRYGKILSARIPCDDVHYLSFLKHAEGQARFLWANPRSTHVIAGFGAAVELSAWGASRMQSIEQQAKELFAESASLACRPKLFGGFAFQKDFVPENAWASFAPAQFVLPHYQLERSYEGSFLSVHVELQGDELSEDDLKEALLARYTLLKEESSAFAEQGDVVSLEDLSSFEAWRQMIEESQGFMRSGELSKVVLSRMKEMQFSKAISPLPALKYLDESYPDCYRFLFEPKAGDAFLGATPELLLDVQDKQVSTMALAASAPRGDSEAEDKQFATDLLADPKERREHELVKEKLEQRLKAFGEVRVAETGVLKLSNIQHIHTAVEATLERLEGILTLLEALHPTPALGGEPFELARDLIDRLEALPRGWFAAPIGYLDADLNGAFAVAIRSAVLQGERAWLFAGAGIMPRSIPEKEWRETAMKFRPMLSALGIKDERG